MERKRLKEKAKNRYNEDLLKLDAQLVYDSFSEGEIITNYMIAWVCTHAWGYWRIKNVIEYLLLIGRIEEKPGSPGCYLIVK